MAFPLTVELISVMSARLLSSFHAAVLQESDIFKTNQVAGAEIASWLKKRFNKKLIARCGYLSSRFMEDGSASRWRIRRAYQIEREAFTVADAVVLSSLRDRKRVVEHHGLRPEKVWVIPNYVVTEHFRPVPDAGASHDLVCVARRGAQKNLPALLDAMHQLVRDKHEVSCLLIGSAATDEGLRRQASEAGLNITFQGRAANQDLPGLLSRCRVFVLPSLYEGHPKVLLEAMSCGLPCIGTDVVGIREDLRHGETGYLCDPDPRPLAAAIREVLGDAGLRQDLGRNARDYVRSRYDIDRVLELELDLIRSLL